jgi:hypothetical protein
MSYMVVEVDFDLAIDRHSLTAQTIWTIRDQKFSL